MIKVTEQVRGRANFLTLGLVLAGGGGVEGWGRGIPPFPASESSPPLSILPTQFTEEKFGQAEKTELDAHFENLLARADSTKNWTEKILRQTEVLLQPNPSEWARGGPGRRAESHWRQAGAAETTRAGLGGRWDLVAGASEACWWVGGGQLKKSAD